jgi:hypothetical protein
MVHQVGFAMQSPSTVQYFRRLLAIFFENEAMARSGTGSGGSTMGQNISDGEVGVSVQGMRSS